MVGTTGTVSLPLFHNTTRTEVDRTGNDDYFQLDIKFKEAIHPLKELKNKDTLILIHTESF